MGKVRDELTDPWGSFLGAVLGGATWAVVTGPVGIAAGLGVGAVVYGVKVAAGVLLGGPDKQPDPPARLPRPGQGTTAACWLERAEAAVAALREQAADPFPGATAVAAEHTAEQAGGVLTALHRLGAQSAAVAQALVRAESVGLDEQAAELRSQAGASPTNSSARRSADAVADRVAARDRLRATRAELDARMQSCALGLEGLVVRIAELRAMATNAGAVDPSAGDLNALTDQVEGLRAGLVDVEQTARRALGQA